MATFRVGVGSFNIKDGAVGFGTDTDGLGNLKVKGVTKTTGSIVSGASTLTRYSGFAADNINQLENITLTSEVGTIGDIVVGVGTSVIISSASTVTVGTVESVSIGTHFSPPKGGIEERGQDFVEGMMRFNTDLNTMEFYNGNEWRQFNYQSDITSSPSGRGRALLMGGDPLDGSMNITRIEFCNIHTLGNTKSFGDLLNTSMRGAALSGNTRALHAGGTTPSYTSTINYNTIASEGDSISFGDLSGGRLGHTGYSSSTRGIWASGYLSADTNIIEYVEIMTLGDAVDFGDATNKSHMANGFSSPTRGVWHLGDIVAPTNYGAVINFVTIASKGNATTFGSLSNEGRDMSSCSNSVRGIFAGGRGSTPAYKDITYVTIASEGNSTNFGDLTVARWMAGQGASSNTRGIFMSGITGDGPSYSDFTNAIDFITIASTGNAQDFGDVSEKSYSGGGCSDSHGGLGGY